MQCQPKDERLKSISNVYGIYEASKWTMDTKNLQFLLLFSLPFNWYIVTFTF